MPVLTFDKAGAQRIVKATRHYERTIRRGRGQNHQDTENTPGIWIQLTGAPSSGNYPWKKVYPIGTGWEDASPSITGTKAREANGTPSLYSSSVPMRFYASFIGYDGSEPVYLFTAAGIQDLRYNEDEKKVQVSYVRGSSDDADWTDKIGTTPKCEPAEDEEEEE